MGLDDGKEGELIKRSEKTRKPRMVLGKHSDHIPKHVEWAG